MSVEENKAILTKLFQELGEGNYDVAAGMLVPNYIHHAHDGNKDVNRFKESSKQL